MAHRYFEGLGPTLNIAHRGGAAIAPENTLEAFRQAISLGCEILELDLQVTRDGVLVVAHDDTLERCTDATGRIDALTFQELQAVDAGFTFTPDGHSFPFRGKGVRIPSFEALLTDPSLAGARLNVELKLEQPGLEHALAKLLRHHGAVPRVCVGSAEEASSLRIREVLPDACHFFPREALLRFVFAVFSGEPPAPEVWDVLDVPLDFEGQRVPTPSLIEAVARAGKWLNVWTVDAPDEMRRLIADGTGGIMTDRPDLLARLPRRPGASREAL